MDLIESILQFSFPFLICYIQSNKIKIRFQVVAWACLVSVLQMLVVWLYIQFILGTPPYQPPPSLWGLLTGKTAEYSLQGGPVGKANYLILYWPTAKAFGGVSRYYSFLHGPELFAQFVGITGLIALDVKNRFWSLLLFLSSIVLIAVSGTRNLWISFPIAVAFHFLIALNKQRNPKLALAIMAIVSFLVLSFPPVADSVSQSLSDTTTYLAEFRENSTESRSRIYQRTVEAVLDNPVTFLLGHKTTKGTLGTHSFFLGDLLYVRGLLGTLLYMLFLGSLSTWLYQTRSNRPTICLSGLFLLLLNFTTMVLGYVAPWSMLLIPMLYQHQSKLLSRKGFA